MERLKIINDGYLGPAVKTDDGVMRLNVLGSGGRMDINPDTGNLLIGIPYEAPKVPDGWEEVVVDGVDVSTGKALIGETLLRRKA